MNLSKSLEVAIAMKGIKKKELAEWMQTTPQQVSNWIGSGSIKQATIIELCKFFNMPVSEFIALGESK